MTYIAIKILCECGEELDDIEVRQSKTVPEVIVTKCRTCADTNYEMGREDEEDEGG